jgi:hypothetical protein
MRVHLHRSPQKLLAEVAEVVFPTAVAAKGQRKGK